MRKFLIHSMTVVGLLAGLALLISYKRTEIPSQELTRAAEGSNSPPPAVPGKTAVQRRPIEKVLAQADALIKARRSDKQVTFAQTADLIEQLNEIPATEADHGRAQGLLFEIRMIDGGVREQERRRLRKQAIEDNVTGRRVYADDLETRFLKDWRDVSVAATGEKGMTLRIRYLLIGRPFVYNLITNIELMERLEEIGFRRLVLTDGYGRTWNCDIASRSC